MQNDKLCILNILIDWYEASPAFAQGRTSSKRRMMRFYGAGKSDYPNYDIENPSRRNDVNTAVCELANAGLVGYEWMKGERGHIISRVWLEYENIDEIYTALNRIPKAHVVDELHAKLVKARSESNADWAIRYIDDVINDVCSKRDTGGRFPPEEQEQDDLLAAIVCLQDSSELEELERVFSMRCFGDSKKFERSVKARVVSVLRRYLVQGGEYSNDEVLKQVGLVRYPEQFDFCGALSIAINGSVLDFSALPYGGALTNDDLKCGEILIDGRITRILTIENRANYIDYVRKNRQENELVLYLGGQFSPARKRFLRAVVWAMPLQCEFYYWGDIDFGGFAILYRLRTEVLAGVQPWRMGKTELMRYCSFTSGFNDSYAGQLKTLLGRPELLDCVACIEYMLDTRVRLEQEAMLI